MIHLHPLCFMIDTTICFWFHAALSYTTVTGSPLTGGPTNRSTDRPCDSFELRRRRRWWKPIPRGTLPAHQLLVRVVSAAVAAVVKIALNSQLAVQARCRIRGGEEIRDRRRRRRELPQQRRRWKPIVVQVLEDVANPWGGEHDGTGTGVVLLVVVVVVVVVVEAHGAVVVQGVHLGNGTARAVAREPQRRDRDRW